MILRLLFGKTVPRLTEAEGDARIEARNRLSAERAERYYRRKK